jgi:hypothetical protein
MSTELHRLATLMMEKADMARAKGDAAAEKIALNTAADYEQRAIDALNEAGLISAVRPQTHQILERSRNALREKAARLVV